MERERLAAVANLAGYPLSAADLEQVAPILADIMEDIEKLRALDLPDDVEPILTFGVAPWV
jgi:Asp-tRNA(Asn)/Glu-tRNA(Gln) amidotransferase C subunit